MSARRLSTPAAAVLGVGGTDVMLMSGDVAWGSLCTTDEVSKLIEELQYSLGEGSCVDAYNGDRVIAEPDLAARRSFAGPTAPPQCSRRACGRAGVRACGRAGVRACGACLPRCAPVPSASARWTCTWRSQARSATTSTPTRW